MIKVSTQAREQVIQMMQSDGYNVSDSFVRVGVKSGGCSGLSYELKFDKELGDDDKLFEDNDVRIVVDKKSFLILWVRPLNIQVASMERALLLTTPMPIAPVGVARVFHYKTGLLWPIQKKN